jgi:tetratricopeptide (TPR) repeat protein
MPIEGPLRELGLSDVLQLLDLSRKTGELSVRRDGRAEPVRMFLEAGAIVGVRAAGVTRRLGELLLLAGKVTQGQIDRALVRQTRDPARLIGSLLVEEEGVPAGEVKRQLRFQVEEVVFDLVRWDDGHFRFEEGAPGDHGGIPVKVGTESLLMEAVRRLDEWAELSKGAEDTDLVPGLVDASRSESVLQLQPVEWEVLAAIDGERTLRALAREVGQGEFEVARAVFGLVSAGVVEIGGKRHPATARGNGSDTLSSSPHRNGAADALREGRTAAEEGKWDAAKVACERAIELDPLLASAYYHLAIVQTRTGNLSGALEAFRTFTSLHPHDGPERSAAKRAIGALSELTDVLGKEEG